MGGESLIRLMRLPGDPAMPPLDHSLVMLGAVLADTDVVDRASRSGDGAWLPLYGAYGAEGLNSGVPEGREEASETSGLLLESLPLAVPLSCLLCFEAGLAKVRWL